MSKEQSTEKMIQEKGLNAPRLTPTLIDDTIIFKDFYVFPRTQLTVCCLTLKNGFTVTGESACASPENFDKAIGEKIAFENARDKIWMLEGYLLKQKLHIENNMEINKMSDKTLGNTCANGATKNVKDIVFWGDSDAFKLISKASSQAEGWMKSTKAMDCDGSVVVQVTTQQRNPDGSYAIAEALTTVHNACISHIWNKDNTKIIRRRIVSNIPEVI